MYLKMENLAEAEKFLSKIIRAGLELEMDLRLHIYTITSKQCWVNITCPCVMNVLTADPKGFEKVTIEKGEQLLT